MGNKMLHSSYVSVLGAKTLEELKGEVSRFTRRLGFDTFSAMTVVDRPDGDSEFAAVGNTPSGYRATQEDRSISRVDPVMQHCRLKSVPIMWNQSTYVDVGQGEKWEHQAQFGYRCGIAFAMHLPHGRHFLYGVDRDKPLPDCPTELSRLTANLQLFAVHAQEVAMRMLVSATMEGHELATLTARERECLRWTMEGKTAWELGRILGIAEQTAVRHLYNASHKLGCVNKHQAVLKALRLDLIR
jgi:DNA-binding CsgD family transcriptional regulator